MNELAKYIALGRRKESTARVRMEPGTGVIIINNRPFDEYFLRETDRIIAKQPLAITENAAKFNIKAKLNACTPQNKAAKSNNLFFVGVITFFRFILFLHLTTLNKINCNQDICLPTFQAFLLNIFQGQL